jgi:hypothetical protein
MRKNSSHKKKVMHHKSKEGPKCQWLMPIILATQESEIRRIMV